MHNPDMKICNTLRGHTKSADSTINSMLEVVEVYSWLSDNHLEIHRNAYHLASFDWSWLVDCATSQLKHPLGSYTTDIIEHRCGLKKW